MATSIYLDELREEFEKATQNKTTLNQTPPTGLIDLEDLKKEFAKPTEQPIIDLDELRAEISAPEQSPTETTTQTPTETIDKAKLLREHPEYTQLLNWGWTYEDLAKMAAEKPETKRFFGLPVLTGKYKQPSGEVTYNPVVGVATALETGLVKGFTFDIPGNIIKVIDSDWSNYEPETKVEKIAHGLGETVGFVGSTITKFLGKTIYDLTGKFFTPKVVKLAKANKLGKATGMELLHSAVSQATTLGTAFAIKAPVQDSFEEDIKNRLMAFESGALVGTIYSGIGVLNPDFISMIAPEGAKYLSLISQPSSPALFTILRSGLAVGSDALLTGGYKGYDLADVAFNLGLSVYFGASTKFMPREAIAAGLAKDILKESNKLKQDNPEKAKVIEEQTNKQLDTLQEVIKTDEIPTATTPVEEKKIFIPEPTPQNPTPEPQVITRKKFVEHQTNWEREKKRSIDKKQFLDTKEEKRNNWDNHRKEVEVETPEQKDIVILNDLKIRTKQAASNVAKLHNEINKGEGSVYNLFTGNRIGKDEYAVGLYPERTLIIENRPVTPEDVHDFISRNIDLLSNPLLSIRTWTNKNNNTVFFDIVKTFKNKAQAVEEGNKYHQLVIHDLGHVNKKGELIRQPSAITVDPNAPSYSSDTLPSTPIAERTFREQIKTIELLHLSPVDKPVGWFTPQAVGRGYGGEEAKSLFIKKNPKNPLLPGQLPSLHFYTRDSLDIMPQRSFGMNLYRTEIDINDLYIAETGKRLPSPQRVISMGKIGVYLPTSNEVRLYVPVNMVRVGKFEDPAALTSQQYSAKRLVEYANSVLSSSGQKIEDFNLTNYFQAKKSGQNIVEIADRAKAITDSKLEQKTPDEAVAEYIKKASDPEDFKQRISNIIKCPHCGKLTSTGDVCDACGADIKAISTEYKQVIDFLNNQNIAKVRKQIEELNKNGTEEQIADVLTNLGILDGDKSVSLIYQSKIVNVYAKNKGRHEVVLKSEIFNNLPPDANVFDILRLLPPDTVVATLGTNPEAIKITAKEALDLYSMPDKGAGITQPFSHYYTEFGTETAALPLRLWRAGNALMTEYRAEAANDIKLIKKTLTPKEQEDLLVYLWWNQKDIRPTLEKKYLITEAPKLNEKQLQILDLLKQRFATWINERINPARAKLGLEPIQPVENYFPAMREIAANRETAAALFTEADPFRVSKRFEKINDPFLKERVPNLDPLEFDLLKIYGAYVNKTSRYVGLADFMAKTNLMLKPINFYVNDTLKTFSLQELKPKYYNELVKYQQGAGFGIVPNIANYVSSDPVVKTMLRVLSKNIAISTLAFNLRSALIQPTSIIGLTPYLPSSDIIWGMKAVLSPKWREFIVKNSEHLPARNFDVAKEVMAIDSSINIFSNEKAFGEFANKFLTNMEKGLTTVGEWGMYPLKTMDFISAQIAGLAAYHNGVRKGLTGKDLTHYIDDIIVKTQGSGAFGDISKAQRGDLGRLVSLFQTFNINQFYLFLHEFKPSERNKFLSPEYFKKVGRVCLWAVICNTFYEDVLKLHSTYPTPERQLWSAITGKQPFLKSLGMIFKEFGEQVPYIGGSLRWSTPYKQFSFSPVLDLFNNTIKATSKVMATGGFKNWKIEDYTVIPRWLGVPGIGEAEKARRRWLQGGTIFQSIWGVKPESLDYPEAKQRKAYREYKQRQRGLNL